MMHVDNRITQTASLKFLLIPLICLMQVKTIGQKSLSLCLATDTLMD